MNEEQKEFINELLKDSNQEHGLRLGNNPDKTIMINGENKTLDDLIKIVKSNSKLKKENNRLISEILKEIVNDDRYDKYNMWIKRTGVKSNVDKPTDNYAKRLVSLIKDLTKDDETKSFNEDDYKVLYVFRQDKFGDKYRTEKSSNIDLNEDDQYMDETNDINLNEIDEKYTKSNDEKSIKNDQISPNELSINETSSTEIETSEKSAKAEDNSIKSNKNNKDKASADEVSIDKSVKSEVKENLNNSVPIIKTKATPAKAANNNKDLIPKSPIVNKSDFSLDDKEKQLFKNIELALSYKNNKEYQDNNVLEFKGVNGKKYEFEKPSEKLKALVHQQIADYMKYLKKIQNKDEFRKLKQEIINKINERYFGDNNEYGFRVYNKKSNTGAIEMKDLEDSKQKRRVKKNYVNQNAPNKFSFFVYNMKDIYSIIEEYFEISLSIHSKTLIESIVRTSVDKYIRIANKSGQISYHTISHGIKNDVIKLIEKYINSKRNIHIKMKFEFDSDSRSKLMEIINKEINRNKNDFKQKSKNIISFIDHLKFF